MFQTGLVEEVQGLLKNGCTGDEKPFESLTIARRISISFAVK